MSNPTHTYTLTDTVGTSGTLDVRDGDAFIEMLRWYGARDDVIDEQMRLLANSLGVNRPGWDHEAAAYLGITVQVNEAGAR